AGGGCVHKRLTDLPNRDAKLSGHLPIDVYVKTGIVERLFKCQITQAGYTAEFSLQLFCIRAISWQTRSRYRHLDRCWCAEIHDLRNNVTCLKGELRSGKHTREFFS